MINNSTVVTASKGGNKRKFMSIREASRGLGIDRKGIGRAAHSGRPTTNGWYITYVPSVEELGKRNTQAAVEGSQEVGENIRKSKILLLDIETAPCLSWTWRMWKENINPVQMVQDWFVISWAAKWLGHDEMYSDCLTPKEILNQDDKRIMESIWAFMNEGDVVITHNGDRFDLPKLNTRFVINGLKPLSPFQSIDTCRAAKKYFAFSHNRLDFLCHTLGIGRKIDTGGFELWRECMDGQRASLDKMTEYNEYDVVLLEGLYLRLRPFIKSHPNLSIYVEKDGVICPYCGGDSLEFDGYYDTQVSSFPALRCKDCGGISRTRGSKVTIKKRKSLLVSCAR
jgi:hemin uptake protein HemP